MANRGWLGIRMATRGDAERAIAAEQVPDEWLKVPNLAWLTKEWDGHGALVLEVFADTPAEKAGLLPGDVVMSFNGIRTQSPGELAFVVQRAVIGHDGEMEVVRDGETRPLLVEVGMHPEDARRQAEEKEAARQAGEADKPPAAAKPAPPAP
jgi:S1-C subfamily serine protease